MYTRELQPPRNSPVEKGKPLTGTWDSAFAYVNLLNIARPYSWPLPRWLKGCRIKEWENFSAQDDRFFLEVFLANFKLYRTAHVSFFNKESGESYIFKKVLPGGSWKMPRRLSHSSVECRSSRFFFRVHTWLHADMIRLDMDIAASRKRPAFTFHLAYNMERQKLTPVAVSLKMNERRNMYAFKALTAVRGNIVLGEQHFSLDSATCSGIFRDYKGFFPYRMRGVFCGGMGFDGEGRRCGFHIAENQAKENRKNNENALWLNGELTLLPPVRITMPGGLESEWVIQDIDGMVDLVFTPKKTYRLGTKMLATSSDFFVALGYYNGMLLSAKEEQIQIRNQWGIGEKLYVRV